MKAPAHFHQLRQECLPHLKAYHADLLKHDRRMIRRRPDLPFFHITREWGTHTILLHPADDPGWPLPGMLAPYLFGHADRYRILKDAETFVDYYERNHTSALVHYFDGKTLTLSSYSYAGHTLRLYAARIRREWVDLDRQRRLALAA